jgi:hypothetical protein
MNKKPYTWHHHPDDQVSQHLVYTLWSPDVEKFVKNVQNMQLIFQIIEFVHLTLLHFDKFFYYASDQILTIGPTDGKIRQLKITSNLASISYNCLFIAIL